jgi:hypothetical protein
MSPSAVSIPLHGDSGPGPFTRDDHVEQLPDQPKRIDLSDHAQVRGARPGVSQYRPLEQMPVAPHVEMEAGLDPTNLGSVAIQEECMSLTKRLERLEAHLRQSQQDEFWVCRRLIYDPRKWEVGQEEAISRMQAAELDRLIAAGEIPEMDRDRVRFIVRIIVDPPERPEDPPRQELAA